MFPRGLCTHRHPSPSLTHSHFPTPTKGELTVRGCDYHRSALTAARTPAPSPPPPSPPSSPAAAPRPALSPSLLLGGGSSRPCWLLALPRDNGAIPGRLGHTLQEQTLGNLTTARPRGLTGEHRLAAETLLRRPSNVLPKVGPSCPCVVSMTTCSS